MFVSKTRYKRLEADFAAIAQLATHYKTEHSKLVAEWNALVRRVNAKGGEEFLDSPSTQLTQDEIKKLLQLCHPDKHGGKQLAVDMTARLLLLRKDA